MNIKDLRKEIRKEILSIDPVAWVEENCTIDGNSLLIRKTGRVYLVDIYREIGISALKPDGKPVIVYKSRQVEMSTTALALDSYFMASGIFGTPNEEEMERGANRKLRRIKVFHVFPQDKQTDRFIKEKATPFLNSARKNIINKAKLKEGADTDRVKQFNGDNSLFFESTGVDGSRLQSLSGDVIFFDEFQHFFKEAIANTTMLLKRARHGPKQRGVQVFFGTPELKGEFFEETWDKSDKRFFNLKCRECGHYFPMFIPETDTWKEIWVRGNIVRCPMCGRNQDKVQAVINGKWIATVPGAPFVGFHLNLFIHPDVTKEAIVRDFPENNPLMTDQKFKNDILGQFYSSDEIVITPQEIRDKCADMDREIAKVGIPNIPTFLGLDWGKKVEGEEGGSSYSVAVIIEGHGEKINILNAFRLKTRDFMKKVDVVEQIFKRYNVRQCVADLGYGEEIVSELQKKMMSRVLGWYNTTNYREPYKYKKGEWYVLSNKDVMIESAYELMRNGKIRFPFASFDDIDFLVQHCCNVHVGTKVVREQMFNTYKKKGRLPNDGLMALCYAITAYKFVISQGFSITSNIMKLKQFQKKEYQPALLGHMPNWK